MIVSSLITKVASTCLREPEAILRQVCKAVREAGQKIMQFYRRGAEVMLKEDNSPLTAADQASHKFLLQALRDLTPRINVVSEESSERCCDSLVGEAWWLVDPLDGTKEFIKGTDEFTVNVALIESGRPGLGVVHAPALHLTYFALRSFGAWRQADNGLPTPIAVRRFDSSDRIGVVASKDHAGPLVKDMLARLKNPVLQSMGSSLKFCLVAEGKADLYLRDLPTMEWDTGAAQCIVEAAGGGEFILDGEPLRYGKTNLKNPAIMTVGDTGFDWKSLISKS